MPQWTSSPEDAWQEYVLSEASNNSRWINDSKPVSQEIGLSKRELFALIVLAQLHNGYTGPGGGWRVGYDPDQGEPNDGYITNGALTIRFEHKVIVEEAKEEVLDEILSTYGKHAKLGPNYGKDRVLVIQPNKAPAHGGLIKISDLTNHISDLAQQIGVACNFDRVLTLVQVALTGDKNRTSVMHLIQHHPPSQSDRAPIAQVDFDFPTGAAIVRHCAIAL